MKEISLSHPRAYLSQLVNRVLPRTTKVRSLMVSFLVDIKAPYFFFRVSYFYKQPCRRV